jgi:hypothetical protein
MDKLRLIAGSGRSGTTWVLDAVAEANGLRPIFEPLHPDSSRIAHRFGYAYLMRETEDDILRDFLSAIANNALHSLWTSYRIRPTRLQPTRQHFRSATELKSLLRIWKVLAHRLWTYRARERRTTVLVKCIRANLMLDWIKGNFDAQIVLLMRHPCAVVESQLRFPEHWDPYWLLSRYRSDDALIEGPLRERTDVLHQELSRPQALAAIWCIENLVPALQATANRYQIVFYEELLERPEEEWQRVAEGLGLAVVPGASLLQQPSQQSAVRLQKQERAGDNYSETYGSWRKRLSSTDIHQIAKVLDSFGVEFYTVSENRPEVELFTRKFLAS